jgi:uncharacterized protein YceK
MMKRMVHLFMCVFAATLMSGCATVVKRTSLSGSEPKGLYPATRADVSGTIDYCRNRLDPVGFARGAGPTHHPNVIEKALWVIFATVDLPISLVTDTVCLPWDAADKRRTKEAPSG